MKSKRTFELSIAFTAIFISVVNAESNAQEKNLEPPGLTTASSGPSLVEAALLKLSNKYGVERDQIRILSSTQRQFPQLGKTVVSTKVIDAISGEIDGISVDESGESVDVETLQEEEYTLTYGEKYRKIHPVLNERISKQQHKHSAKPISVIIWLRDDKTATDVEAEGISRIDLENDLKAGLNDDIVFGKLKSKRAVAVAPIIAKAKSRVGNFDPGVTANPYVPVLYSRLTPDQILEISEFPEIETIYEDSINSPQLEVAVPTIGADVVHNLGVTGNGVNVGVIEVGGRYAAGNPFLTALQDVTNVCATADPHATGVAGIIASTNTTRGGVSPDVNLRVGGSCTGSNTQLHDAATRAVNWGASVLNLSFGHNSNLIPDADDRFYDRIVRDFYRSVVVAAGNEAGTCNSGTGNVLSPGIAYNVITVGNFDDRNTVSWSGDIMNSCSSWRNPTTTHGGREKPEVDAPGTNINSTTTSYPWTGNIGSGTSFAAPMVTGLAALMMEREPTLKVWPEAVKAIIMTTAYHTGLEGEGGISANRAADLAIYRGGHNTQGWWAESYDCSAPTDYDIEENYFFAGQRTRVTIVWDQNTDYSNYQNQPSADLDLQVINSSTQQIVQQSSSWDNNYELVDFVPSTSGLYKLRVHKYRCDSSPGWLAIAWRNGN